MSSFWVLVEATAEHRSSKLCGRRIFSSRCLINRCLFRWCSKRHCKCMKGLFPGEKLHRRLSTCRPCCVTTNLLGKAMNEWRYCRNFWCCWLSTLPMLNVKPVFLHNVDTTGQTTAPHVTSYLQTIKFHGAKTMAPCPFLPLPSFDGDADHSSSRGTIVETGSSLDFWDSCWDGS